MNKTVTISPKDLSKLSDKPVVVLPVKEYEELIEDLEMLRSVELPKRIAKARKDVAAGKYYTHEEVKRQLGL